MAWEDVPAKLAHYRTLEYEADVNADRLLANFGVFDDADLDMIPVYKRAEFEEQLDYRIGACENLAVSVGWSPEKLRKV